MHEYLSSDGAYRNSKLEVRNPDLTLDASYTHTGFQKNNWNSDDGLDFIISRSVATSIVYAIV